MIRRVDRRAATRSALRPSPKPGATITPSVLGRQFVPRRSSRRWMVSPLSARLTGKYVLVLPTLPGPGPDPHRLV